MNVMQRLPIVSHEHHGNAVEIKLNAAVVAIQRDAPSFLVIPSGGPSGQHLQLPSGTFIPSDHPSLEFGLRSAVLEQTGVELGYLEQLYTFGDQTALTLGGAAHVPVVTLGYLALTCAEKMPAAQPAQWSRAYDFLPWEDWREGRPDILTTDLEPKLQSWAAANIPNAGQAELSARSDRMRISFGLDGAPWDEERVLDRFELLQDAGLLAARSLDGTSIPFAQRRIIAAGLGRLRAKMKYRPVLFELMAPEFTLFELQRTVEAILGSRLHKQNFRRLVESGGLVDSTDDIRTHTGGRPAKLFRFRREVLLERQAAGVRVKGGLAA